MSEPLAFWNGRLVPESQVSLSIYDQGFLLGITVSERLRTFGGQLFQLDRHLQRLQHSLQIVQVDAGFTRQQLSEAANQLVGHNHRLLEAGDDLGLSLFVTPGKTLPLDQTATPSPTVVMHTYPLPFHQWRHLYHRGQALVVSETRQVPVNCWPSELKCRSRMHYYLADCEAARRQPGARALLLDQDGFVSEASTANVLLYDRQRLLSPPLERILPGVTIGVVSELADRLQIGLEYRDLMVDDVLAADEVILCSTSPCVVPVVEVNGQRIGSGAPGGCFQNLLQQFNQLVGLDLEAQAVQFAQRR